MNIQAYLRLLELESVQDRDLLHRAYRRQVKRWHPDQFAHQPEMHALAEERLKKINHAYQALKQYLRKKRHTTVNTDNTPPTPSPDQTGSKRRERDTASSSSSGRRSWFTPWSSRARTENNTSEQSRGFRYQERQRPPSDKTRPNFGRVLDDVARSKLKKRAGFHAAMRCSARKRKKSKLRVDGFAPASPITPVPPVSKIGRIDGSD